MSDRRITMPELVEALSQPDDVDLSDTLVQLWAASTEQHAEDGYAQQARILSAMLGREVNPEYVNNAMSACKRISHLEHGGCVTFEYPGWANSEGNRAGWLDHEQEVLRIAVNNIRGLR